MSNNKFYWIAYYKDEDGLYNIASFKTEKELYEFYGIIKDSYNCIYSIFDEHFLTKKEVGELKKQFVKTYYFYDGENMKGLKNAGQ